MKKIVLAFAFMLSALVAIWILLPQEAARLEIHPKVGQQMTFALDYDSNANASSSFTALADPSSGTQSLSIRLIAKLRWTVLSQDADATEFLLELIPQLDQSSETARRLISSKALARLRLGRNGDLINLMMPQENFNGPSILVTEVLRHFIPILAKKEVSHGERWTSEESIGNGEPTPTAWTLAELNAGTAALVKEYGPMPRLRLISNTRYELDRHTRFLNKIIVSLDSESTDVTRRILSSLKLTATLLDTGEVDSQEIASFLLPLKTTKMVQENLRNEVLMQLQEQLVIEKTLGNETVDSIQAQLKAADPKGQNANMPIYNKLKALFILQPRSVEAFTPALMEYDRLDDRFSMVATALTSVGSPEAQKVLRDAIDRLDGDETKKQRLIPNLL